MGKVWMIASGKGGTGKTMLAAALAVTLAKHRHRVCVIDMDIGLRSIDLMLGMENKTVFDFFDLAAGDCKLTEALVAHQSYPQLQLITASQSENADAFKKEKLAKILKILKKQFDYILIDCPSGIGRMIGEIGSLADDCILLTTADDMSMRAVERTASVLMDNKELYLHLAVNRVDRELIKNNLTMQPKQIADFLGIPLIGEIPQNESIYRLQLEHKAAGETTDKKLAAVFESIALRMEGNEAEFETYRVRRTKWH